MFRRIINIFLIWISMALPCLASEKPLNIAATQTIFADLVKQIGGNKVSVHAVASPKYNLHFIQPKPSDVRKVARADLYVNAGLDLEVWSDPLLEAAGNPRLFRGAERNLDLSRGVPLLDIPSESVSRAQGDIHLFGNPHFQMNPRNAQIMAASIASKLKEMDPANGNFYETNLKNFQAKLENKIREWQGLCGDCQGKEIISYHADIAYFVDFLGVKVGGFLEPKPGIPPTPKQLAFLENYAKAHQIKAIILPTYYSRTAADELSRRTKAKVVIICQGVGELPGTDDVFSFFDYNFKQISEAFR